MNTIEIILAGAGSGKTFTLAERLQTEIDGGARPHAILATTFTRDAAAELTGRARDRLLDAGRTEQAHQLGAARIGTVNAVCGALVETFAFELGLSPDLVVVDEGAAAQHIRRCVSTVLADEDAAKRTRLSSVFGKSQQAAFDLETVVIEIIAAARSNELGSAALELSAERSVEEVLSLLGPVPTRADLEGQLADALEALIPKLEASSVGKDKTAAKLCKRALACLRAGAPLPWPQWNSLARRLDPSVGRRADAAEVQAIAEQHIHHPQFAADLRTAIELAFEIAGRAITAYQEFKTERGLLDFADQEAYALQLLRMPEVAARLGEDLDLVLVDEFQDTSPLQLAIFLQLAQIAPVNVWVGDPKQSIYGFRGTDPEMMTAAVDQLEGRDPAFVDAALHRLFERTTPTTLGTSYRSRPGLVNLTSELFARAFALQEMPRERVVLSPERNDEPEGLGPLVEFWDLEIPKGKRSGDLRCLASGIDSLLERGFNVRERVADGSERARPGTADDIALLSRRRATRDTAAAALEALGHRVRLPRVGLLDTLEGRALWAGLRRWVDRRDSHAAAELERLLGDDTPQRWLQATLDDPGRAGFAHAIDRIREHTPHAGPREAAAHCCAALSLRTACRRWGDAQERLANLDAFFAFIDGHVANRTAHGKAPTVPGLLAALERAAKDRLRDDAQAVQMGREAVTASTWHAAKGLEWPVVVLFDVESEFPSRTGGVSVQPNDAGLDLSAPLDGRWIRFIPHPYDGNTKHAAYLERLAQTDVEQESARRQAREHLRVLYVAWTRARDRLILAGSARHAFTKALTVLRDEAGPLLRPPEGPSTTWAGCTLDVPTTRPPALDPQPRATEASPTHALPESPVPWPLAYQTPSQSVGEAEVLEVVELGSATEVHGLDGPELGEAFHAFIAADRGDDRLARERNATRTLTAWDTGRPDLAPTFVDAADRLAAFLHARFPGVAARKEVPIARHFDYATGLRGFLDLWIPGHAIIDHKVLVGTRERQQAAAQQYAGQLDAYARATGGDVQRWVHLPLAGLMVRLGRVQSDLSEVF